MEDDTLSRWLNKVRDASLFDDDVPLDKNARSMCNDTLLHIAASWNDYNVIGFLVARGDDINATEGDGFTPLHEAVGQNSYESIEVLCKLGANVHLENRVGCTPLEWAQISKDVRAIGILKKYDKSITRFEENKPTRQP